MRALLNTRRTAALLGPLLLGPLPLGGCGLFGRDGPPPPPEISLGGDPLATETVSLRDGAGLNLPRTLDGFSRRDVSADPKGHAVSATYQGATGTAVTIRVRRAGDGGSLLSSADNVSTSRNSERALRRAVAATGQAPAGPEGNLFLVRFGAIQAGRTATVAGGAETVDAFCCVDGLWSYEYTIDGPSTDASARFVRDLPWSASPGNSIEEPR